MDAVIVSDVKVVGAGVTDDPYRKCVSRDVLPFMAW
jgi:hypothetical protein